MPNINVEVSEGLLRSVRIRCAQEGMSQKDFVLRALLRDVKGGYDGDMQEAWGDESKTSVQGRGMRGVRGKAERAIKSSGQEKNPKAVGQGGKTEAATPAIPSHPMIPGEKCSQCKAGVYEVKHPDTGAIRWKCVGERVHTMSPRVKE